MSEYVSFEAIIYENNIVNGQSEPKVVPLNYHKCDVNEPGFFEPKEAQVGFISAMMPQLNCFDNALDLDIWGNFQVTSVKTI